MKSLATLFSALLLAGVCTLSWAQRGGACGPVTEGGYASPSNSGFSYRKGVRFERRREPGGYILRIHLRGYTPDAIQVRTQGRFLVVENRESQRMEQRDDRGGYRFTSTASNLRRRFFLPPDANPAGMQRKDGKEMIVITIPYAGGPSN